MRAILTLAAGLALSGCLADAEIADTEKTIEPGFSPKILVGENRPENRAALQSWIDESVALFTSTAFEANLAKVAQSYPKVYISGDRDVIPTDKLIDLLHLRDITAPNLWWPETYVILTDDPAGRFIPPASEFGFHLARNAGAGPNSREPFPQKTGEIELGHLHFARYTRGDQMERACAMNTMVHEISHSLSDKPDRFWMHILDTGDDDNAPDGTFEASYLLGTVAQCTWLEGEGRIEPESFMSCVLSFSDPDKDSRFLSSACDDYPDGTEVTPR